MKSPTLCEVCSYIGVINIVNIIKTLLEQISEIDKVTEHFGWKMTGKVNSNSAVC